MKLSQRKLIKQLLIATVSATALTWCGNVYAAEDVNAESASNNVVNVNEDSYNFNGTTRSVSDGYNFVYGGGYESSSYPAFGNTVAIYGGRFNGIFGGMSMNSAYNNRLIFNGGTVAGGLIGGAGIFYGSSIGDVFGNFVEVHGGTVANVSGGEIAYGYLADESSPSYSNALGNVYNNTVNVTGGNITNGIIGGAALGGNAYGNTINITGGKVSGNVIGGYTRGGTANNNTINISGTPDLSGATLYGGRVGSSPYARGNTLNINTWGLTARNIYGFENINFKVASTGSNAALTLTSGSTNFSNALPNLTVSVPGNSNLRQGDKLTLFHNDNGISLGSVNSYKGLMNVGASFDYDLNLALSGDRRNLDGTIGENRGLKENNPTQNALLAGAKTVDFSTQHLVNSFSDYVGSYNSDEDGYFVPMSESLPIINTMEAFGNIGGGRMNVKTEGGGHIKMNNFNFDLGLARTYETGKGKWVFAPVFEHGKSSYDATLANGIAGSGDTKYTAGGLIGRIIYNSGIYVETSLRFGRSKNDFHSSDFTIKNVRGEEQNVSASYNTSSSVWAGHIRLGKAMLLNPSNLLDIYGIFSYTRQGSDDTHLSLGERYRFSSVSSSRLRLGYRLTTRTSKISRIYTGIALQYDRTKDAYTEVQDLNGRYWKLPSTGSKGLSGMIEVGWMIRPRKENPWLLDITATGWLGKQKGLIAVANIKKAF